MLREWSLERHERSTPTRHFNSPSRLGNTLPRSRLWFSGQRILGRFRPGQMVLRRITVLGRTRGLWQRWRRGFNGWRTLCVGKNHRASAGVRISHLAPEIRKRKWVWMAVQKATGLMVDERTDKCSSVMTMSSWQTSLIRRKGEKIMRMVMTKVNIYD